MLHALRRATTATVALFLASSVSSVVLADTPLPSDPSLVTGTLDNGLKYVVKQHANPTGRAVMWIHIDSGSLNETDKQRGIAHYLEHMAFNGSENFAPGSLVPFFQSLGMQFGRDQNAFTSFDQTVYQLSLPNVEDATLDKGMTFFSDVVGKLSLSPGEIDNERGIIQEERRRRLSGRQRVGEYIMERMAPGSLYGVRSPIGTEGTINSVMRNDFLDYYNKYYTASNATMMVVADAPADKIVGMIKTKFAEAPKVDKPAKQDVNIKAYEKSFAIVASDPEVRSEDVSITRIEPAKPATTTEEQYREDLVKSLGVGALNARFGDKVAKGGTTYQSARVSSSNDPGIMYSVDLSIRPQPGKWKEAMEEASMELQRARKFGFTQREIEDEKKERISAAEWAVNTEESATAQAIISRINGSVANGTPVMSAAQRLDLLKKVLPTIKNEEVAAAFAKEFDFPAAAFILTLPASGSIPSEAEVLAAGTKALSVTPTPEAEKQYATELLSALPTPGKVVDGLEHTPSSVWSGWLSNNVRVHHKFMDLNKDEVTVSISLIGGELLETAENRGITSAAQLAFGRAATSKLSSTDIRELMTGKKVRVGGGFGGGGRGGGRRGGGGGGDTVSLSISGSPSDLEAGFQLAYLMLTDPKIETASFLQYQSMARQALEESLKNPASVGARLAGSIAFPDDEARTKPITAEQIDKLTVEAAQAHLTKLIAESPIEVTIVGDLPREKALDLAAKYLGALPARPKVSAETYADLRKIKRPAGPRVVEKAIETPTPQAFVSSGFYGPDQTNRADTRAMSMAARILSTRMVKEVREDAQLVYSIGAQSRAGSTYPGFGFFGASAPTDPPKAQPLADKLASMYATFAKEGPTQEELDVAKKQFANTFEQDLKEPRYWSQRISNLTYRGTSLDEVMEDPSAYASLTTEQVKNTFAKYYSKDNAIVVIVKPASNATSSAR